MQEKADKKVILADRIVGSVVQFIVRRKFLVLCAFILVTAFWGYEVSNLSIKTYFPDLLPGNHEYIKLIKEYPDFGGTNSVLIELAVKDGDIFKAEVMQKIIDISGKLVYFPGVDRNKVYSIGVRKVKNFMVTAWGLSFPPLLYPSPPTTDEGMEQLKGNIYSNTLYYGKMVSLDSKSALITADFFDEGVDYREVYDKLEEIRKDYEDENTSIFIVGDPYLYGLISSYLGQTAVLFTITLLSMIAFAYMYTKSLRLTLIPLVSMIICAVWGLGFITLCGFHLDPLILVLPLLVSARALSHSIQFNWRINEEYYERGDVKKACEATMKGLMYPGLSGIITDGVGILLIAFIPIPIMSKLGIMCFVWAMSMVFVILILNPVIYLYLPGMKNIKEWRERKQGGISENLMSFTAKLSAGRNMWYVFAIAAILFVVCGYYSTTLQVGDMQPGSPLLRPYSTYNKDCVRIGEDFPGLMDPLIIIATAEDMEGIRDPDIQNAMEDLQFSLMMTPEVTGVLCITSLVKNLMRKFQENNPKFYTLPNTHKGIGTLLQFLKSGGAQPGDFDTYYTFDYGAANLRVYCKDHTTETIKNVLRNCADGIARLPKKEGVDYKLAGGRIGVIAATNDSVEENQTIILVLAFALTFLLCAFFLRSFMAGFLLIIPLALANALVFAYMGLRDIGVSLQTLPVSTVAVGIGVDYGIYLISRIREAYQNCGNLEEAINEAIRTAGNAITITALIIVLGVFFWIFSTIKFQSDMGYLLSLVTFFHLLGTLIFLPALVRFVKPGFIINSFTGKEGKEVAEA